MTGARTAVVLGASGAIGGAVAAHLVKDGWVVVAHGNAAEPDVDGATAVVRADLTDFAATRAMADAVLDRHDAVELLVNCAGRRDDGLFVAQSPERWMASLTANVAAAHHPVRAFLPSMVKRRQGCVVQVASVAALVGSPGQTAYSAAKAAVLAMTRSLAVEYGSRGVRFNAVAPGFVESAMTAGVGTDARRAIAERQAIAGTVAAADVARVVAMLADTPSITGEVVTVDLGLRA